MSVNYDKETSEGTFENKMERESSADKTQKMDTEIEKETSKNNVLIWISKSL